MKNYYQFAAFFFVIIFIGCKDKNAYTPIKNSQANVSEIHKVVVNEFLDAGTYTYLNVTEGNTSYWMAILSTKVNVGATYYYTNGMVMKNFESSQLNKKFETIIFAEAISTTEDMVLKTTNNPHENSNKQLSDTIKIELPKNGISLAELFKNKTSLVNKLVVVRGKVVKINNNILNKNWVHVIDGTEFEGKHNITVTTSELVQIGDTVTFKGIVILNKDFGQGYIYDILIENGKLLN